MVCNGYSISRCYPALWHGKIAYFEGNKFAIVTISWDETSVLVVESLEVLSVVPDVL